MPRNAGGRLTVGAIEDVAFISYMVETMGLEGPLFEVAVIHHTQCGTGFLADESFRHGFAGRTGFDEKALADEAVTDPAATVRADVGRLLAAPQVSPRITVSGHVYDLETGLVSTIVSATAPQRVQHGHGHERAADVIDLFRAGEPVDVVAAEFGLSRDEVEDALRVDTRRAA